MAAIAKFHNNEIFITHGLMWANNKNNSRKSPYVLFIFTQHIFLLLGIIYGQGGEDFHFRGRQK